jgi:hypothetical protein
MGFPAAAGSVESTFRNKIDGKSRKKNLKIVITVKLPTQNQDVAALLDESHPDHYLVFNLSQRVYDYEKFHGRVVDWCGFPDHHGAPLPLLIRT